MEPISDTGMQNADIILYHGNSWIAKAIRFFDNSEVNHAALYLGKKRVGEALPAGLTARTLRESIKTNKYVIIQRLKSYPNTMTPVLDKAKDYISTGNRYGFEQIVLLAFLGITRKLPVNVYLQWLLRKVLDEASELLMEDGKEQPMICSEFVYRCYHEATSSLPNPYSLDINPFPVKMITGFIKTLKIIEPLPRVGMHKDSLLVWAADVVKENKRVPLSKVTLFNKGLIAKTQVRKGTEDDKLASMSLDMLIKNYLQATKKTLGNTLKMEASLHNEEMLKSITNFTNAYYVVSRKKTDRVKSLTIDVPTGLAHALDTVADFVTPGDLYKCNNLYHVGKITP